MVVTGRSVPSLSTTHSSGGRAPTVASTVTRPAPTASDWDITSPVASRSGSPIGCPVVGSTAKRHGWVRPRSVTSATIASPSHAGPGRESTIQPVRSVSAHCPTGRSRSGASATAGADSSARPTNRVGDRSSKKSGSSTPTPAISTQSREYTGRPTGPRSARISLGSPPTAPAPVAAATSQIDDRGVRSASCRGSATNAIARESGRHTIPVTPPSIVVSWRAFAPRRAATTNSCGRRSR